jgi:Cu/Ag efflux protein CusF
MEIRGTLGRVVAAFVRGCAVISAITAFAAVPNVYFPVTASSSSVELLQAVFAPAPVMAQTLVEGKGKVIAVTQEKQELVLEHGEIKGFMDAMTMGYKVSSPALLKGLKSGDQVLFTIDKNKSVITKVTKLKN